MLFILIAGVPEDCSRLIATELLSLMLGFISGFAQKLSKNNLIVVTNTEKLSESLKDINILKLSNLQFKNYHSILKTVASVSCIRKEDILVLIDCRNPFLDIDCLLKIVSNLPKNQTIVSISPNIPSPYYFYQLLNIKAAGSLHLIDFNWAEHDLSWLYPNGYRTTMPFVFRWNFYSSIKSNKIYFHHVKENQLTLKSLEEALPFDPPKCLYVQEGHDRARAIIPISDSCDGVQLPMDKQDLLMLKIDGKKVRLFFNGNNPQGLLSLIPFSSNRLLPSLILKLHFSEQGWVTNWQFPDSTTGFLFHITSPIIRGMPSVIRKIYCPELWLGDRLSSDGSIIFGRQRAPKVFCISGDLFYGNVSDLLKLQTLIDHQLVTGIELPFPSVIVNTMKNYIRSLAIRKAYFQN